MKEGSLSISALLIRLWHQVSFRRRMQFLALFVLTVIASFAEMLSVSAVLPFIGLITDAQRMFAHPWARYLIQPLGLRTPQELLLVITILFAAAAFWSGLMRLLLLWVQSRLGYAIGADFSLVMYNKTLYQPYSVHITRNSSEIIAGISNKAKSIVSTTILPLLGIFSAVLMVVTILGALLSIDPVISLMALVGFGLIYVLAIVIAKRRLVRCSQQISQGNNQLVKVVQEGLGGIRDVLIDGTQDVYRKAYESVEVPLQQAMADVQIISLSPRYGVEALGMVLISVLAYFLVGRSDSGASAIPVLGAFALGAQRMLPMLQQSYAGVASILGSKVLLQDSLELMEQPLPERVNDAVKLKFEREIAFKELSFGYVENGPVILHGINIEIAKGRRIGIIGNTGSGKSTILDILMGLLPASAGGLYIDGVRVDEQNRRGWQKRIAHVPQAIFLSDASISENIALGVPKDEIDHARVAAAAKQAQAAAFIESLEQRYETRVGERGVRLSGGQRQRIGIARALYKQADVLILDEATSALDNDTEREVMQAIDSMGGNLTVIIVAHRLSTLKNCDLLIELDAGKIKRIGTFDEIVGALA